MELELCIFWIDIIVDVAKCFNGSQGVVGSQICIVFGVRIRKSLNPGNIAIYLVEYPKNVLISNLKIKNHLKLDHFKKYNYHVKILYKETFLN